MLLTATRSYAFPIFVNSLTGVRSVADLRVGISPFGIWRPGVPPTHRKIHHDVVVVVQFRGDKLACERIYWDHADVLRQAGLLKT